ncbi:MAG: hypothetical protein JSW66_15860 [Phycisphaerales bacterium]|nr:MAG: hypothetical protein JSW66_15860 [Phycisphaerales bacterium]
MKSLTRTMTILVVLNLAMGGFGFAQDAVGGEKTPTYTISGSVSLPGVVMRGLPGNVIADQRGYYSVAIPYGWAGVVAPAKEGYTFAPPVRNYTKVGADLTNQNYAPSPVSDEVSARSEDMYGSWQPPGAVSSTGRRRGRSTGYRPAVSPVGSRKVLVVPAEDVQPEELAAITEDMQVMAYILDERFKETRRIQGVFIDFGDFFGRDNRQTEATYIQGYGVLFSMEVNFSFSPPRKQQAQETELPGEQVDSTWQRARQQVFAPGEFKSAGASDSADEYNRQMVAELERELTATLKHAANIRGLQADEWVILTVVGRGRSNTGMFGGAMMGGTSSSGGPAYGAFSAAGMGGGYGTSGGFGAGMMGGAMMGGAGGMAGYGEMMGVASPTTVMTIRAKKSAVDAFAEGQLDFDRFREMVKTVMY